MRYLCNAPDGKTWHRMETEANAISESTLMRHTVEQHFRQAMEAAAFAACSHCSRHEPRPAHRMARLSSRPGCGGGRVAIMPSISCYLVVRPIAGPATQAHIGSVAADVLVRAPPA
jgi:hypothetical protein